MKTKNIELVPLTVDICLKKYTKENPKLLKRLLTI